MLNNRKYIESDGFKLSYTVQGNGTPVIVVGSSLYYSRSFSENLSNHLQLICMDWRGFTESPANQLPNAFELNTLLNDIELLRQKLGLEKIIIMGHSAHGLLALEYAKKYPQFVSHVIMIGISPNLSPKNAQVAEQYWQESVWLERKDAYILRSQQFTNDYLAALEPSERFVQWYVMRQGPKAWYDFNFNASELWKDVHPNMNAFDYLYGIVLRDLDITQGLQAFNIPVFLALGRYDYIIAPPSVWDPLRSLFSSLTVRVFERSGHSPYYEQPDLFDHEVLSWVRKS